MTLIDKAVGDHNKAIQDLTFTMSSDSDTAAWL